MNNWLDDNKEQIDYYVSSKDIILIERKKHLELMVELFCSYFSGKTGLRFLDIGCGDGALSKMMCDLFSENEFHLLDGSKMMIEKAKENLKSGKVSFFNETFENFFGKNTNENYYDFIYSSLAIHHVEHHKKLELYSKIYTLLKQGGLFINIDVVLPAALKTEAIQFKMWTDYINVLLKSSKRENEIGTHDNLPDIYKGKSENKPSSLISQLNMLNDIGFRDVECYHKYGIFVLIGGVK